MINEHDKITRKNGLNSVLSLGEYLLELEKKLIPNYETITKRANGVISLKLSEKEFNKNNHNYYNNHEQDIINEGIGTSHEPQNTIKNTINTINISSLDLILLELIKRHPGNHMQSLYSLTVTELGVPQQKRFNIAEEYHKVLPLFNSIGIVTTQHHKTSMGSMRESIHDSFFRMDDLFYLDEKGLLNNIVLSALPVDDEMGRDFKKYFPVIYDSKNNSA